MGQDLAYPPVEAATRSGLSSAVDSARVLKLTTADAVWHTAQRGSDKSAIGPVNYRWIHASRVEGRIFPARTKIAGPFVWVGSGWGCPPPLSRSDSRVERESDP